MTLLVILGAGASSDIISNVSPGTQPPLTNEIFPRFGGLLARYPGASIVWTQMLHGLQKPGETIETQLQSLRDAAVEHDPLKRHLLSVQFFLQDAFGQVSETWSSAAYPTEVNNLRYLVSRVELWRDRAASRILYATFNYDTLLEAELTRNIGTDFTKMDGYMGAQRSVIKVHGSWNWKRVAAGPTPEDIEGRKYKAVIDAAPLLTPTPEFHVVRQAGQFMLDDRVLLPAVSIPVVRKDASEFNCPVVHLAQMREWLKDVSHVLVVGWHGAEQHFLKELATNLRAGADLTIVGRVAEGREHDDRIEAEQALDLDWVKTVGVFGSAVKYRSGFSRFIRDNVDDWLAALPT